MSGLCERCMEREARSAHDLYCDPCEVAKTTLRYTNRGFRDYGAIQHSYGGTVTIRQSSNAEGDFVWLFINNKGTGLDTDDAAHLSVDEAKAIIEMLSVFVREAEEDTMP